MIDKQIKQIFGPVVRLHSSDNVVIARAPIEAGVEILDDIITTGPVMAGYKIATQPIKKGDAIRKYNVVIGYADSDIKVGTMLENHNVMFHEGQKDYAFCRDYVPVELLPENEQATFQGYIRDDGQVGTRNFIAIVATVNCSATVVHAIADYFNEDRLVEFPNIDGVAAFSHHLGCGMPQTGEPMNLLHRTLGGYITHSNVASALIIGLGCERCQIGGLLGAQGIKESPRVRTMVMQDSGGTRASIVAGIEAVKEMLPDANNHTREKVSAKHIKVGLQCGGSDSFSSITANPGLGRAVDILARHGGTGILSETPEIYGVEHTLTSRAATREVGDKLVERIRWWKEYCHGQDVQINGKVSPGNQKGGLANITEKSLGSSMKGGTGPLMEVYEYAYPVIASGLVFMDTPGYDPVSATGQIAGGANMIAFTTGRGSCFGAKPAPSLKLASNTYMYKRMTEDMDINCGEIVDGTATLDEMGQKIFQLFLDTASGKATCSEALNLGRHEFVPWQIGVVG